MLEKLRGVLNKIKYMLQKDGGDVELIRFDSNFFLRF
jgi:Fe-S cluster biogenesis protein NfuA